MIRSTLAAMSVLGACRAPMALGPGSSAVTPASPASPRAAACDPLADGDELALGPAAASRPIGDPIAVHLAQPQVGDLRAFTISNHDVFDVRGTYDKTRSSQSRIAHLRTKVAAVDGDHPVKLEVTGDEVERFGEVPSRALAMNGFEKVVFAGRYLVAAFEAQPWPIGERTSVKVVKLAGTDADISDLGDLFGDAMREADPLATLVSARPLRLGEVVALSDADKHLLVRDDLGWPQPLCLKGSEGSGCTPMVGTYTLACTKVEHGAATYELDIDSKASGRDGSTEALRLRRVVTLELATGAIRERLQVFELDERYPGTVLDGVAHDQVTHQRTAEELLATP